LQFIHESRTIDAAARSAVEIVADIEVPGDVKAIGALLGRKDSWPETFHQES
jgi:hypothetical protein